MPDTCQWTDKNYVTDLDTRQKIVDALTQQANHGSSSPTEMTFGDQTATHLTMSVPADFYRTTCDQDYMRPIVVFTAVQANATSADAAEAQAILESVQIEDN